jgi:hypothetical protein
MAHKWSDVRRSRLDPERDASVRERVEAELRSIPEEGEAAVAPPSPEKNLSACDCSPEDLWECGAPGCPAKKD